MIIVGMIIGFVGSIVILSGMIHDNDDYIKKLEEQDNLLKKELLDSRENNRQLRHLNNIQEESLKLLREEYGK